MHGLEQRGSDGSKIPVPFRLRRHSDAGAPMTARNRVAVALSSLVVPAAFVGLVLGAGARSVQAQQTATQTVLLRVIASSQASVQNAVAAVPMRSTGMGTAVTTGTYGITTNETNQKIVASLDRPMPQGMSLSVTMAVPVGASALAGTTVGTPAVDVVTGIPVSASSGLPITYSVHGSSARAKAERRVVTYTFMTGI